MRPIDADALIKWLNDTYCDTSKILWNYNHHVMAMDMIEIIENYPTIEERNCGAKMDEKDGRGGKRMISESIKICIAEREKIIEMIAERVVARKNANGDMQKSTFLAEIKELHEKADMYLMVLSDLTSHSENHTEVTQEKEVQQEQKAPEKEVPAPKRRITRRASR